MLTFDSVPWYGREQECAHARLSVRGKFPGWETRFSECEDRGFRAGVAQLVEHLICNQRVGGSNPFASSTQTKTEAEWKQRQASFWTGVLKWDAGPVLCGNPHEVHAPKRRMLPGQPELSGRSDARKRIGE